MIFKAEAIPGLKLTDSLNGNITLVGGYDSPFVDGNGVQFQFSAQAIPEPTGIALFTAAALCSVRRRR